MLAHSSSNTQAQAHGHGSSGALELSYDRDSGLRFHGVRDILGKFLGIRDYMTYDTNVNTNSLSSELADGMPAVLQLCAIALKTGGRVAFVGDSERQDHYIAILKKLGVDNKTVRDSTAFHMIPLVEMNDDDTRSELEQAADMMMTTDLRKISKRIHGFLDTEDLRPSVVVIADANALDDLNAGSRELLYRFLQNLKVKMRLSDGSTGESRIGVLIRYEAVAEASSSGNEFLSNFCGDMSDISISFQPLASGYAPDMNGNVTACQRVSYLKDSLTPVCESVCKSYKVTEQGIKLLQSKR